MKRVNILALSIIAAMAILGSVPVYAEEGGGGHYMPGANASFVDALPGKPGLAIANFFAYYNASANVSKLGGLVTAGIDATAYADTVIALYRTDMTLLGGYYVAGVAVPYVWMTVKGSAQLTGPGGGTVTRTVRDTANGFGDITVYPFMLGWVTGDLKTDLRLGVYAPTGDYETNRLANVGRNYWTFEPAVSVSWFSSKFGTEITAFAGLDFSTRNDATDYQSGDVFHVDGTVAQHLPLGKLGVIGLGANAFYYQQVTPDSGVGAKLGDFKGRTIGIGPVVSFITKVGKCDVVAEVKWLPELDVAKRIKGDIVWAKLGVAF